MCGIFGILGNVDRELMNAMSQTLKHRGPDDSGFFFDDNVALGNTRLSIIDVKGGHQPIHNEDSSIWTVFNGEIYNFQELRTELEGLGHKFTTNADTEVIVHAYEQWKEDCVQKFNGMWAFAIWDSNKKQLFLSRDRFGIKPLYYFSNQKGFIFASEIKAILQDKSVPHIPNDKIIYEYLAHSLLDHTEQTFFSHIKRLLPAHNLLVNGNEVRVQRYWQIPCINRQIESSKADDNAYIERFLELFKDSVKLELISEVPLGSCLSGGLDSSSIVVTINQLLRRNVELTRVIGERQKTFTACFDDKQINERKYVEEVITQTKAEENLVFPTSEQLWKDVQNLVHIQEEPFMSSSVYAQWRVMQLASKQVKVVLDGQGGDELFGGYISSYLVYLRDLWRNRKLGTFVKELFLSLDLTAPSIRRYFFSFFSKRLTGIEELLNTEFVFQSRHNVATDLTYKDLPDLLQGEITKSSLPALLRYEDRNSMAFSVEARVPILDYRLVEYIFSLPVDLRLKNGWTKYILRNAMKDILPENVRKRRKKIAFVTPEKTWLRQLSKQIREVFESKEFGERRYFNQREVLKRFDEFCAGKSDRYADVFWRILNLELWLRDFINE